MNTRNILAVTATAALLACVAWLIELSMHLPEPIAYFAIAILAAGLTLVLAKGGATKPRRARHSGTAHANLTKERGNVKWFSASKGFGFITRDNGEDIFVHFRSISGSGHRILREGQRVEFAVTEGSKGLQAEDVSALK